MYIRIRSWHIIRTWTRVPNRALTLCGRVSMGETSNDFGNDASCESCFRLNEKALAKTRAEGL